VLAQHLSTPRHARHLHGLWHWRARARDHVLYVRPYRRERIESCVALLQKRQWSKVTHERRAVTQPIVANVDCDELGARRNSGAALNHVVTQVEHPEPGE
jgi:hypothetical protein